MMIYTDTTFEYCSQQMLNWDLGEPNMETFIHLQWPLYPGQCHGETGQSLSQEYRVWGGNKP